MLKLYEKYAPTATNAFMTRLTEYVETDKLANDLYNEAMIMEDNDLGMSCIEEFNSAFGNQLLRLMTISADLGNKNAIKWLHKHGPFIMRVLTTKRAEVETYELFMDRVNFEKNAYSLCMLGILHNKCKEPNLWSIMRINSGTENNPDEYKKLVTKFFTQAGEKGNPQGFYELAYMLYNDSSMDKNYEENMKHIRLWIHLSECLDGKFAKRRITSICSRLSALDVDKIFDDKMFDDKMFDEKKLLKELKNFTNDHANETTDKFVGLLGARDNPELHEVCNTLVKNIVHIFKENGVSNIGDTLKKVAENAKTSIDPNKMKSLIAQAESMGGTNKVLSDIVANY